MALRPAQQEDGLFCWSADCVSKTAFWVIKNQSEEMVTQLCFNFTFSLFDIFVSMSVFSAG